MAVLKPRERLVYFRVSEDEFRQFVSVCEQAGARSVSDLARSAVQRLIADGVRERRDEELANKMYHLERMIALVTQQLELLNNHTHTEILNEFPEASSAVAGSDHTKLNGQAKE